MTWMAISLENDLAAGCSFRRWCVRWNVQYRHSTGVMLGRIARPSTAWSSPRHKLLSTEGIYQYKTDIAMHCIWFYDHFTYHEIHDQLNPSQIITERLQEVKLFCLLVLVRLCFDLGKEVVDKNTVSIYGIFLTLKASLPNLRFSMLT